MGTEERTLDRVAGLTILIILLFGLVAEGPGAGLAGFLKLQTVPVRLLSDFSAVAGPGGALLNSGVVGILGAAFLRLNRIRLSGPTLAALFIMIGFGLFGKTVMNCIPIMAGVALAARIAGKAPREYALIAMFGTSLGPIVGFLTLESGLSPLPGALVGTAGGIAAGLVLPSLAIAMLHLHQGYTLYNIGLTAGFLALFVAGIFQAAGGQIQPVSTMFEGDDYFLMTIVPVLAVLFIAIGAGLAGKRAFSDFLRLQKLPGRLPSDFVDMVSLPGTLVNMGAMGLVCYLYVRIVGATISGPVLGAMLTVMGFAAFGMNLRNSTPVMAGVLAATLLFGVDPAKVGPITALVFSAGLAPLAGEFGIGIGFVAGFLHYVMSDRTTFWHGGMNLYNNGFAAGLTAAFLVAVIEWYRSNRID